MTPSIFFTLLLIAAATLTAGLFISKKERVWVQKAMPYLITISTGIIFWLCFFEFLPFIYQNNFEYTSLLVIVGLLSIVIAEKYLAPRLVSEKSEDCHAHHIHGSPSTCSTNFESIKQKQGNLFYPAACSSIGCILVCSFFDGIEVLTAFHLNKTAGIAAGAGMFFHIVPQGAMVASIGLAGGLSKKGLQKSVFLVGGTFLLGGLVGSMATEFLDLQKVIFPLASGVLIYTSIGHLLPMVLKSKFGFIGIIAIISIISLFTHSH